MKIRKPWMIKAAGFSVAWALRLWFGTLSYRCRALEPDADPKNREGHGRYIYAFWHEGLLLPAYLYGRCHVQVLISEHADGKLIAEVCRHLGYSIVHGSPNRGAVRATRQMLDAASTDNLAITPDGPRGPRRRVQMGLVYLASRTGRLIVPAGIGYDRPWRARSWDRFGLPRPWSRATWLTGEPIRVPPRARREELEEYRLRVEDELQRLTEAAERLAAGTPGFSPCIAEASSL
jgi:lysophospholipid acyltransferase (LPLAT)-like uncharacterized protein